MEKFIQNTKYFILNTLVVIFPFFFLNITQEYFVTNKLYLLGFGVLLLLFISTIEILFIKKISWKKNPLDGLILLFLTSVALSTLFSSPNKIQALLNPNFGLLMLVFLTILYIYLSRISTNFNEFQQISTIFLSVTTIVFYFQPFKNIALPQNFTFLKNPTFSPVGSQLDLAILLGFFVVWGIVSFLRPHVIPSKEGIQTKISWIPLFRGMTLIINFLALFLTIYSMIRAGRDLPLQLPPFRLSWFASLEILKNPQTAIIGIGPDNFSSIFTRVKDFAYNQSSLWQVPSFNVSHSAILQILTETGLFGLLSFGLLIFFAFKQLISTNFNEFQRISNICLFIYLIICLLIFPPSLIIWFLFFVTLAQISCTDGACPVSTIDFTDLLPVYLSVVIVSLGLIGGAGYFLSRSYASEYFFKKSLNGIANNNLKQVYDNQRQTIILNPYIERFRSNFAQTNLIIANNLSNKVQTPNSGVSTELTEQDRQTITQAIQAGISEGKAAVTLNPQRAGNWENLAVIYSNIINVATGADVWTISAYQRAILLDPQNPVYRVGLGGIYYSQKKYDDALKFFEQAVSLKPDWANANYNYAWVNFQKENYPQAVNAMQNTLNLLNPKLNKTDYEKVQKELEEFKKGTSNLNLPSPPATQLSPKLELPREASLEAK